MNTLSDYPLFCPSGSGWGRYCCQYQENGFWHGDCCVLPFGVGWLIAIIIVGVVILARKSSHFFVERKALKSGNPSRQST